MSKIGKQQVIFSKIIINNNKNIFKIKGKYGSLDLCTLKNIKLFINNNYIIISPRFYSIKVISIWGLIRTLINNLIIGVAKTFIKKLIVIGTGYNAKNVSNNLLILNLGYSHEILYHVSPLIKIKCYKNYIAVQGCNKYLIGQICSDIKKIKKNNSYIDKGVRYYREIFIKKIGKKK